MSAVILAAVRSRKSTGAGHSAKRQSSEISFHALRHTATSLLKNTGVSDVVAREFIGHNSAAVSKHYTHIDTDTLRKAADRMPDLGLSAASRLEGNR
ncbi:MAG: tyrosine-type recombinase/integrase [Rhodospirillales bacterium]|nr:tyrosine-type recombinase/integrase [Acetobacter sp.]